MGVWWLFGVLTVLVVLWLFTLWRYHKLGQLRQGLRELWRYCRTCLIVAAVLFGIGYVLEGGSVSSAPESGGVDGIYAVLLLFIGLVIVIMVLALGAITAYRKTIGSRPSANSDLLDN